MQGRFPPRPGRPPLASTRAGRAQPRATACPAAAPRPHRQLIASPRTAPTAPPCRTRAASLRGSALACISSLATARPRPGGLPWRSGLSRLESAALFLPSPRPRFAPPRLAPKAAAAPPRHALTCLAKPRRASPRPSYEPRRPPALATPSLSQRPAFPRLVTRCAASPRAATPCLYSIFHALRCLVACSVLPRSSAVACHPSARPAHALSCHALPFPPPYHVPSLSLPPPRIACLATRRLAPGPPLPATLSGLASPGAAAPRLAVPRPILIEK